MLDGLGWVAGYRASYADVPQLPDGGAPPSYLWLSIMLLRFPDNAAAKEAASALEHANWTDFGETVAAPLPKHPEIAARYTPGTGALLLDTPMGPFVLRLMLEAPPDGIEKHIGELDAAIDAEQALLRDFKPTPVAEIPSLPRDPDGLLARMVATDPAEPTATVSYLRRIRAHWRTSRPTACDPQGQALREVGRGPVRGVGRPAPVPFARQPGRQGHVGRVPCAVVRHRTRDRG